MPSFAKLRWAFIAEDNAGNRTTEAVKVTYYAKLTITTAALAPAKQGSAYGPAGAGVRLSAAGAAGPFTIRTSELADAAAANRIAPNGEWYESVDVDLSLDARRLLVHIPMGFTDMLAKNAELALAWRICTRAIFTTYFDRGYKAVDFFLNRPERRGAYLLAREN